MSEIANITLIGLSQISQLPACSVLYLILVSFWKNRQTHYGAKNWYELIWQLDVSFVDDIFIPQYYQRKPKYLRRIVSFLFFCWLFEISHTELFNFLKSNKSRFWFRFLPVHDRFLRTASEFQGTSGQNVEIHDLQGCFTRIIEQIFRLIRVDQLSDDDLLNYAKYFTFRVKSVSDLPQDSKGMDYFANFIFSLGLGASLALCKKHKDNYKRLITGFGYSTTQLVQTIFSTLGNKNITRLAKEMRNHVVVSERPSPCPQVLRMFIQDLDVNKVVPLYENFIQNIRQYRNLSKIVVAIDATIIEVYGDYEGANWIYDHHQHQYVWGYKLYLIFDVTHKVPIGYLLATSESECTKLLELVEKAKQMVGGKNIHFTVFDKGYFDTANFARLDDDGDKFVTLGKKYKTFKDIIAIFENDLSLYQRVDEKEMRVTFYLTDFINYTSDKELKWARVTIRRILTTKVQKDKKTGQRITKTVVEHFIYLTNILYGKVEDIVKEYGTRVAIENFFEELKNAYFIKGFPGTSLEVVKVYITLILLAQLLLWFFCFLLVTKDLKKPYQNKELSTLKLDLLNRHTVELFDLTEIIDDQTLEIQKAIESDIAFIRRFRRFIQRTKRGQNKISASRCISA